MVFTYLGHFRNLAASCLKELEQTKPGARCIAKKSIPKMIEGKAYAKCLRVCLLKDAALNLTLLHTDIESTSKNEDEEQISDNDCYKEMDIDNNIFSTTAQWSTNPTETDNDVSDSINSVEETEYTAEEVNQIISFSRSGPLSERVNVMEEVSEKVLSKKESENDTPKQTLKDWHSYIESLKLKWGGSRTARYWLMFIRFISIMWIFNRAERTGNWELHIEASQDMLPYFAASGHNNYSK